MISSTDSYNGMQIYELDEETNSLSIKTYANSAFVNEKKLVSENGLPLDISEDNTIPNPIVPFAYERTVISGVNMNTLITDADFINASTMSSSSIQKFFDTSLPKLVLFCTVPWQTYYSLNDNAEILSSFQSKVIGTFFS